ncbi:MAG TPA: alpha/beta fold hydrolase, partial [Candidatus Krumholzibacteria bacterium]
MNAADRVLLLILAAAVLWPAVPAAADRPGQVTLWPYEFVTKDGQKVEAEMGTLTVPENRRNPSGRMVELAFLRFKSTSSKPGSPITFLAGGPGGSGIEAARGELFPIFMTMRQIADVIALDQRGTGRSKPSLLCRESWFFDVSRPADLSELVETTRREARSCAESLRQDGVDLAAYNTIESADDLEDLRKALGAEKLNLWSTSYGTQLALAAIRRHEGSIDRVIMAGVQGPDHGVRSPASVEAILHKIDRIAAEDPQISRQIPDLFGLMDELLTRLEKEPVKIEAYDRLAGRTYEVHAGRTELQLFLARLLGRASDIERLPAQLHAMSQGDFSHLGLFVLHRRKGWLGPALPYLMNCASGVSPEKFATFRLEEGHTLLGRTYEFPFPDVCEAWGVPSLGSDYRSAFHAEIPALLISGTLDARTPSSNAEEVAGWLPNSGQLIIERAGHGLDLFLASPQIADVMVRFFAGETVTPSQISSSHFEFAALGSLKE